MHNVSGIFLCTYCWMKNNLLLHDFKSPKECPYSAFFFFLNRSRVIYSLATHWKCPCFICSGDLHNAVSYPLCPLSTHLSASSLHLPFLWKGEAAKVGGGMPEGTGIWLGNRSAFLHSPVFWDHGLHSALHRQTKRKITKWKTGTGYWALCYCWIEWECAYVYFPSFQGAQTRLFRCSVHRHGLAW